MFTPKSKLARSSSIGGTKISSALNCSKKQSLYSAKSKSFFSPSKSHSKSLNITEFALESENGTAVENILTEYKSNLPLVISEALIEADDNICGKFLDSNWLIIVYNQKLLVWNITEEDQLMNLPISYSTNSDLVVLDVFNKNHLTCFAANKDGLCRYWNRPHGANNFIEMQLNLQLGEICTCACVYLPSHILIGTSQGRMFVIDTRAATSLSFRLIKSGGGMLSGFSKRVSYFFSSDNDQSLQKPIHKLLCYVGNSNSRDVYVLTSESLQMWTMTVGSERMIYNLLLLPLFETIAPNHLDFENVENLSINIMDIIIIGHNIIVMAGLNEGSAEESHYVLGYLALDNNTPSEFSDFKLARFSYPILPGGHMAKYRCMYKQEADVLYFYNENTVACIKLKEDKASEIVALPNIAAGIYKKRAIFLTIDGIIVQIEEARHLANVSILESMSQRHNFSKIDTSILSLRNDKDNTIPLLRQSDEVADDEITLFKNAFILYMKNGPGDTQVQEVLHRLFPSAEEGESAVDSLLNQLVVSLSLYLINDRPASDPRWTQAMQPGVAATSHSLILRHQLNDKMKAHHLFINFLHGTKLWNQLSSIRKLGSITPTIIVLSEHIEKLVAANVLSEFHLEMVDIVDEAIEKCVKARGGVTIPNNLTCQDLFYKEISRIDEIFLYLQESEEVKLSTNLDTNEKIQLLLKINKIFLGLLDKVYEYRSSTRVFVDAIDPKVDYIPWTVSYGVVGTRTAISKQISLCTEMVVSNIKDVELQYEMWYQIRQLTDHLLCGLKLALANSQNLDNTKSFEVTRRELLVPFVENDQFDSALFLAEKFYDFQIIIMICLQNSDEERLQSYFTKLQDKGFAEAYFSWCVAEGKEEYLFNQFYAGHPLLERFLEAPQYKNLCWLYFSRNKLYEKAFNVLFVLSNEEIASITRKKTLLSLAKLNARLSNKSECINQIEVINNNLDLIIYQEQLAEKQNIMENLGLTSINEMRVYSPIELIEIYVGHYNEDASEYDFKKAIDLLRFCDENDRDIQWREILIDIWCKAILRDNWKGQVNTTDIIGSCKNKIVYKLMNLLSTDGYLMEKFIPSIEDLLQNKDLRNLEEFLSLQCQLMALHEHLQRNINIQN